MGYGRQLLHSPHWMLEGLQAPLWVGAEGIPRKTAHRFDQALWKRQFTHGKRKAGEALGAAERAPRGGMLPF